MALRSLTYLILVFVTFISKSRSSFLPNTSSDIESALTGATPSIASGSPNPEVPFECYPMSTRRGPLLDRSDCRQAVTDFYRRFPRETSGGAHVLYSLTHSKWRQPPFALKCPYVVAYSGCVLTLDYYKEDGGDIANVHSNLLEYWGTKIARTCVGNSPEQNVDGGAAIWQYPGTLIRLALAHTRMPLASAYGNLTSVGNGSAALVSSTASNLAVNSDTNGSLEISDSK